MHVFDPHARTVTDLESFVEDDHTFRKIVALCRKKGLVHEECCVPSNGYGGLVRSISKTIPGTQAC